MTDWNLVGGNPAPGSPDKLEWRCGHLQRSVDALEELRRELQKISDGTREAKWQGKAAEAMRDTLAEYQTDLGPIAQSFESVVNVLRGHARNLRDIQSRARQAVNKAELAQRSIKKTQGSLSASSSAIAAQRQSLQGSENEEWSHYQRALADVSLNDPGLAASNASTARSLAARSQQLRRTVAQSEHEHRKLESRLQAEEGDLKSQRGVTDKLREEWERLSKADARRVDAALDDSLRNRSNLQKFLDGAGDFFKGLVTDIVDFIRNPSWESFRKALSALGTIIAIVALVVAIVAIPFTGGASIAVFAAAFKVLAVASLVVASLKLVSTVVLLKRGSSSVSGTDLLLDTVGVALAAGGVSSAFKHAGVAAMRGSVHTNKGQFFRPENRLLFQHLKRRAVIEGNKMVLRDAVRDVAIDQVDEHVVRPLAKAMEAAVPRVVPIPRECLPVPVPPLFPIPVIPRIPPLRFDIDLNVNVDIGIRAKVGTGP